MDDLRLDGNAAGGLLGEIFGLEMTTALTTCTGCGSVGPVGTLMVYMHGMGTIIRCPHCDQALIRVAQVRGRYYLDLRGVRVLQLEEEHWSQPQ